MGATFDVGVGRKRGVCFETGRQLKAKQSKSTEELGEVSVRSFLFGWLRVT